MAVDVAFGGRDDGWKVGEKMSNEEEDVPTLSVVQHLEIMNVTLMRIYDTLGAVANKLDPEIWAMLSDLHESGGLHNGPAYMNEDPWRTGDKE